MIPTTRGTWGQMVPSASSTTMSAIPTDAMVDFWIEIIIYIQIYWWLRSPDLGNYYGAWHVWSDGVLYLVDGSYGRESPDLEK